MSEVRAGCPKLGHTSLLCQNGKLFNQLDYIFFVFSRLYVPQIYTTYLYFISYPSNLSVWTNAWFERSKMYFVLCSGTRARGWTSIVSCARTVHCSTRSTSSATGGSMSTALRYVFSNQCNTFNIEIFAVFFCFFYTTDLRIFFISSDFV